MPTNAELSNRAQAAWRRKFGEQHHDLDPNDPEPFKPSQRIGGGGNGTVYATELGGVPLALKRVYTRILEDHHLNEIDILSQLSGLQHEHVVTMIGSFTRRRKRGYEIDIVMYPLATCDLAGFLRDLDVLMRWREASGPTKEEKDDANRAFKALSSFDEAPKHSTSLDSRPHVQHLIAMGQKKLLSNFACIAQAVAYMHRQKIRHKDIKPAQILLSPTGLWVTDFGWSLNTAELAHSTTNNGFPMTIKYQAPERANGKACGRAEDVFALGCVLLEMATRLTPSGQAIRDSWTSQDARIWSFQAHLRNIDKWLAPLLDRGSVVPTYLPPLLKKMMAPRPEERPGMDQVVQALGAVPCRCAKGR